MQSFAKWLEQSQGRPKPWKAKKKEILSFWSTLAPSTPIVPARPIPDNHQGSTYTYDGIRVTGSRQFVNSIISRIKDILNYEGENTKLEVIYKQQIDKATEMPLPNSFVFYVQIQEKVGKPDGFPRIA